MAALYSFFEKSAVLESFDGTSLKLDGQVTTNVHAHKQELWRPDLSSLSDIKKQEVTRGQTEAMRLFNQIGDDEDHSFVFINCRLMNVLKPIDIMVNKLQSGKENFISALEVVNSVIEHIN